MDGQRGLGIMDIANLMDNKALLRNHGLLLLLTRGHRLLLHKHGLRLLPTKGYRLLLRGWHHLPKGHRLPERRWKWLMMLLLHVGLLLLHYGLLLLQQDVLLLLH